MIGQWVGGMFLCEVKGHTLHERICIRGWLECIAIRNTPEFFKRKSKNATWIYETTFSRPKYECTKSNRTQL